MANLLLKTGPQGMRMGRITNAQLVTTGSASNADIIVLSSPATKIASKPRSEAVITGAAETWMTSTSLAISAGKARAEDMEIISTSKPSLAKPPVSFAIHMDAMVPDVNR